MTYIAPVYAYDTPVIQQIEVFQPLYGATTTELAIAIAYAESNLNPNAKNPSGTDAGLYQWTKSAWKDAECIGSPYNIQDSTICTMEAIKDNELWRWDASREDMPNHTGWFNRLSSSTQQFILQKDRLCSCVVYASRFILLPPIKTPADLPTNSYPLIGGAVLLEYSIGGSHIGIITKFVEGGFEIREANFRRCKESFRFISWQDTHIRGFYSP